MKMAQKRVLTSRGATSSERAWSLIRDTLQRGRSRELPLLEGSSSNDECANMANLYFVQKIEKLRASIKPTDGSTARDANELLKSISRENSFSLSCVGPKTIIKAIKGINGTSSIGVDGIPMTFWKKCAHELAVPIMHMVNSSIRMATFPDMFKESIVHPIHKGHGKDTLDPASYRPVSILPALSKILERVICDQLMDYLETNKLIPCQQHGFRKHHSTTTALISALSKWTDLRHDSGGVTVAAFDFSAAFDTISSRILKDRLEALGVSTSTIRWFDSYMAGGRQKVSWNGSLSSILPIKWGVRQGSILGPLLFVIVTMITALHMGKDFLVYADDSSAWHSDINALSEAAMTFSNMAADMGLVLNPSKTQLLTLGGGNRFGKVIKVDDEIVEQRDQIELLGFKVDQKLSPTPYAEDMLQSLSQRLGVLRRLKAKLPPNILSILAKSIVLGKVQVYAGLTFRVRLTKDAPRSVLATKIQTVLNDVARLLLGKRRADKISSEDLIHQAGLKSLNHIVAEVSGWLAWKMSRECHPLHGLFLEASMDPRTRSACSGLLRVPAVGNENLGLWNAFSIWNKAEKLRDASSEGDAKRCLKKFVRTIPL